jgi:hypothetical protein
MAPNLRWLTAFGLSLILAVAGVSVFSVRNYLDTVKWRNHTNKVISELFALGVVIESAESSQRGYLISGKEDYLPALEGDRKELSTHLENIRTLVSDNPVQSERLNRLESQIHERVESLENNAQLYHAGQRARAIELIAGPGRQLMTSVHAGLKEMQDEEFGLLEQRSTQAEMEFRRIGWVVSSALIVAFILLAIASLLLNSENRRRRLTEGELVGAKIKAQEANELKTRFLANMSHEIRTPLNGIIGMSRLLEQTELHERQRDYVETIKVSSHTLLTLINEILDISKIESGKMQLEDTHFELKSLIEGTISIVDFAAKSNSLEITMEIAPDVPEFYLGDALRLRQVLLNLLNNAVKFSERGKIIVRVSRRDLFDSQARLFFEVVDSGVGIDPETREKLFEVFTQGDASTSRRYGGSGLGLAISRQIVQMMGGKIDVESIKGVGSRFFFDVTLKVAKYDAVVRPVASEKMVLKNLNGHLLIVEDNKANQKVIVEMTKLLGCRSRVVENGYVALKALQQDEFNLVLMDGQMPLMDGYEATRLIRAGQAGDNNMKIPIIATTANAIQGDIERCLLAGMNDYIAKPISYDDLAFKVEKWILRGHRAIDPAAIARLQQLAAKGNLKLLEELIELFGQDSPDALQKMRDFLDAQDFPRLSQKAHTLKSSAANIGALRLRDLCERIERVRPEVGIQNISGLIDSAEREFRLALEELYLLRKT